MTTEQLESGAALPYMDGPAVFKKAVVKFPEVIKEALSANNMQVPLEMRKQLASITFDQTSEYDRMISDYLGAG